MKSNLARTCGYELEIQVLRSAAGWYLGTFTSELGPVSRDSGYYASKEEAEKTLQLINSLEENS